MMEVIRITGFGLLLSGLGVDSDALAVIPWVPGNYSSNRCLRNIPTVNPPSITIEGDNLHSVHEITINFWLAKIKISSQRHTFLQ